MAGELCSEGLLGDPCRIYTNCGCSDTQLNMSVLRIFNDGEQTRSCFSLSGFGFKKMDTVLLVRRLLANSKLMEISETAPSV